ncbi:cytochrome c oxidase assembly factor Coa1 family protein [Neptunomonas antarctica]|uniref:Cytochrome oxidase complex assembly protein 1 n=1 Tax=Neptunomonas antarctica TaxID=619304 RepID=A0A1N7L4E9_9GAMM|nr:cytochrome c oxidase assembly factor Coa1 family protein [Neptunomonas antarctica]SIS68694.1 Cytochrome oxidase complex assembly protein 1 [Neptunomonas antarctica]
MNQEQEYISGLGKDSVVPPELKGWNWGAFLLNWIWGIGNSTYIAFLMFVPLVNIVMFFMLGAKGNEWAWKNRTWRDIEHFKQTQRKWRNAGLILLFVVFPLLFTLLGSMLKGEVFDQSMVTISQNTEVIEVVGEPIEAGYFVMGSIQTSGTRGEASLQYSISGPKREADVYVQAYKEMEAWSLYNVIVHIPETDKKIQVVSPVE